MTDYGFDAVIFDLDGVITKTALVHSAAWKKMFDDYLKERAEKYGEKFKEFTHTNDYLKYVDGKPRYKGVESFLISREIKLPFGNPSDSVEKETICGIGNRKNFAFNEILKKDGAQVYDSTVLLIKKLKEKGIRVGVASSSKNCEAVLKAVGILNLMETRVDGVVSAELGLHGKPKPDIFTTACDNLGVTYDRAVVVEDAVSGVQAGKKGNFGLVLGIARENNDNELKINGADIVVKDIDEIGFDGIVNWFKNGLEKDNWSLVYFNYDPKKERSREALLSVGNGYFGTRGAMEETVANDINYPGTYIAGVYNRLKSQVGDREVENEDFVNCPNWLPINFKIGEDDWIDINNIEIKSINKTLNFQSGVLSRELIIQDKKGRKTKISSKRLVSMDNPHLAAIEYTLKPLNYSGKITVKSGLDGKLINAGVERYKQLNQKHLRPVLQGGENNSNFVVVRTSQSDIKIAEASKINVSLDKKSIEPAYIPDITEGTAFTKFNYNLNKNNTLTINKIVSIYTSRDKDINGPLKSAKQDIEGVNSFNEVLSKSEKKWEDIWKEIDIIIEGDRLAQKLLRLHLYHLIVTSSPHNTKIDAGIPARGLHGEAYRGHIFWDELYILPFYDIHFKDIAKSLLLYRYRRLDEARKYAEKYGYKGAMFPWQSGSNGREETQTLHLNPLSGKWSDDYSSLQRHVSLAIAYNIWQYFHISNDLKFIKEYGAEMFFEICRFWASKSEYNFNTGRYEIKKVMGPDEFHEKYKNADEGGLKDNTYTNLMLVWTLKKAFELLNLIDNKAKAKILNKINLTENEIKKWQDIVKKLNIEISDEGILAQFDGYFNLKELDWETFKKKYGNIHRMDRILKAEGKSADDYKVAKQADTLMTFYNLDKNEIDSILTGLGYKLPKNYLKNNLEYYLKRTSHGSTLSRVVHAWLANLIGDKKISWKLYSEALSSDYDDIQGGTTGEGIHTGVMAGTVIIALMSYAGLNLRSDIVRFFPCLPEHWRKISFNFRFRKNHYYCEVSPELIRIKVIGFDDEKIKVEVCGIKYRIDSNEWIKIKYVANQY
ncbi:MAG: beta-phosphoglucomutase family hydrolase [Bacteroidales bacterium]|nr:beta-phosphoglucomutase family hydrolase [Bacteroidales bacterium]